MTELELLKAEQVQVYTDLNEAWKQFDEWKEKVLTLVSKADSLRHRIWRLERVPSN